MLDSTTVKVCRSHTAQQKAGRLANAPRGRTAGWVFTYEDGSPLHPHADVAGLVGSGAPAVAPDVEVSNVDARRLYERLGYAVVGPHRHHWRAIDPATGQVVREGESDTWAMRKTL